MKHGMLSQLRRISLCVLINALLVPSGFAEAQAPDVACKGLFAASKRTDGRVATLKSLHVALETYIRENQALPKQADLLAQAGVSRAEYAELKEGLKTPSYRKLIELSTGALTSKAFQTFRAKKLEAPALDYIMTNHAFDLAKFAEAQGIDKDLLVLLYSNSEGIVEAVLPTDSEAAEKLRGKYRRRYAELAKQSKVMPSEEQFAQELGVADLSGFVKLGLFESFDDVRTEALAQFDDKFEDVENTLRFNDDYRERLRQAIVSHKRIVVSTVVASQMVHPGFLESLRTYCQENDAIMILRPLDSRTHRIDESLFEEEDWIFVATDEWELSRYLRIADIKRSPTQVDATRGLDQAGPRGQSVIVASPRLRARVIHTADNSNHPHILYSTGAMTVGDYDPSKQYVATKGHRLGALVLERPTQSLVTKDKADELTPFHVRRIVYNELKGGFTDLDKFYSADGTIEPINPMAMVAEIHVGYTDPAGHERLREAIKKYKPEELIAHDIFDGYAINHHEAGRGVTKGKQALLGKLALADEIGLVIDFINDKLALDPNLKVIIPEANHNMRLRNWVELGHFNHDPQNYAVGMLLSAAMTVYGYENPLEFAVKELGKDPKNAAILSKFVTDPDRVIFKKGGDPYFRGPKGSEVALGYHGHAGANGAKGSMATFKKAADRLVFGHTHTLAWDDHTVNNPTITVLDMGYNGDGLSNWVQGITLVSPYGDIQPLIFANGEFSATDGNTLKNGAPEAGYPFVKHAN